jgi:hypothetical protein
MIFLYIAAVIILLEVTLLTTVKALRKNFQWLITEKDEKPELDKNGLKKFFNSSYDPKLGWVRKPNTTGKERGQKGEITFHIDSLGARQNPRQTGKPEIAAFGDSYVFARQVEDDETWEAQLSEMIGRDVMNFGVGNYGADQGLIRYERTRLPDDIKVAILGFVPETICRVHSYWKHYLEFGNTFAFKPRFRLTNKSELELLENPMKTPGHFDKLDEIIPAVRDKDEFYERKFRSVQFRFPYLLSFFRNPKRNSDIIGALIYREMKKLFGTVLATIENLPFRQIMKYNIKGSHAMYGEENSKLLLKKILNRFKEKALSRGHKPLILVMPQLLDLELTRGEKAPYHQFYEGLKAEIDVIDMTPVFKKMEFRKLYIDDQYGGHLSKEGNKLVAEEIEKWYQTIK